MTTYTTKSNAVRAAKKALGNDAIPTIDFVVVEQTTDGPRGSKHTAWVWMPKKEAAFWEAKDAALAEVTPADAASPATPADEGIAAVKADDEVLYFGSQEHAEAYAEVHAVAAVEPVPEFAQEPAPVKPAKKAKAEPKAKAAPAPKVAKEKAPAAPKEARGPIGKTAQMIALCARPEGATPADLRAIAGGDANPWPYCIHNPKGTGWAQRFGYDFRNEKVEGKARYFLTPKK